MTSTDTQAPMMIRADITPEEWLALRRLALDRRVAVQWLVGQLIREHLAAQKD